MGLYLCVFDKSGSEIEGVEVGFYDDFCVFRDAIAATVEGGEVATVCKVLQGHSDCDGLWTVDEAKLLLEELELIRIKLPGFPPVEYNSPWKIDVAKLFGIEPKNLLECFFDIDGEPLVDRLCDLANASIAHDVPIIFQ